MKKESNAPEFRVSRTPAKLCNHGYTHEEARGTTVPRLPSHLNSTISGIHPVSRVASLFARRAITSIPPPPQTFRPNTPTVTVCTRYVLAFRPHHLPPALSVLLFWSWNYHRPDIPPRTPARPSNAPIAASHLNPRHHGLVQAQGHRAQGRA